MSSSNRGCTIESRRLMGPSAADISNRLDIDKLDRCSETSLGLAAVALLTILIWVFALPVFDVFGMSWIKGWERLHPSEDPSQPLLTMADYKQRLLAEYEGPADAFQAMDRDEDEFVDFNEFMNEAKKLEPPLTGEQARFAFDGLDENRDHLLEATEFSNGLSFDEFFHFQQNTTLSTTATAVAPTTTSSHASTSSSAQEAASTTTAEAAAASATSTERSTTTAKVEVPHVSMKEFKSRFHGDAGASARNAFVSLDTAGNEYLERDEFIKAVQNLQPPMDAAQADVVFNRLDTNLDDRVESLEFFMAFEADMFLRPTGTTDALLTVKEYRARMGNSHEGAEVNMEISNVTFDQLSDETKSAIKSNLAKDFAYLAGVDQEAVSDLGGNPASVSMSKAGSGGIQAQAIVRVPTGESSDDVVAVLASGATKHYVSNHLATSKELKPALKDGTLTKENVRISVKPRPSPLFMASDIDEDGLLSEREFGNAAESFTPQLTPAETAFAFKSLDKKGDGLLTSAEFMGESFGTSTSGAHDDATTAPATSGVHDAATTSAATTVAAAATTTETATSTATATATSTGTLTATRTATGTATRTLTKTTTTTAAAAAGAGPPITMEQFKERIKAGYGSMEDAWTACDADANDRLTLKEFGECTGQFQPPLDDRLAEYTFAGLDANHNGEVSKAEFFDVIKVGEFFPTEEELKEVGDSDTDPPITMKEFKERMEESVESETDARLLRDSALSAFLGKDQLVERGRRGLSN